jgi:chromosomal replication initiation ATPase DnaA
MSSQSAHQIDLDTAGTAGWPGLTRPHDASDTSRRLRLLIEDIVAGVFGVDPEDLRKPTRGQARIALARQVAMYIAHVGFSMTLTEVGELFARDRTTVAHACTVVEQRRDDGAFDASVVLLEQIIRAVNVAGVAADGPVLDGMR